MGSADGFHRLSQMQVAHFLHDHQINRAHESDRDGRGNQSVSGDQLEPAASQQKHSQIKWQQDGRIETRQSTQGRCDRSEVQMSRPRVSQPEIELIHRQHHQRQSRHFQHDVAAVVKNQRSDRIQNHHHGRSIRIHNAARHAINAPAGDDETDQNQPAGDFS